MVISSNRSPSPISNSKTNQRTPVNSTPRKSFCGNSVNNPLFVRKSQNFNPVTPANTPTEFSQRSSLLNEYQENDKDHNLKPIRISSSSPVTKHFMAPTISTASKIAAPSPRKKILGEWNESVRVSCSDSVRVSDDKKILFAEKIESCSDSVSSSQVLTPKVSSIKNLSFTETVEADLVVDSGSQVPIKTLETSMSSVSDSIENLIVETKESPDSSITEANQSKPDENSVVMEEKLSTNSVPELVKPPCSSPLPVLAPLDLDPSLLPPYDPKTNILSPRPVFLCYRPNPRIEAYRNKGTKLEDIFTTSESCSDDTENTEESVYSVESADVVSSEEVVFEAVEEQIQEKNEKILYKKMSRSTFVRTKIIPFLLVLVIACLCFTVTDTPVYSDDSSFKVGTSVMERSPIDLIYNWVELSASYLSGLKFIPKGVDTMIPFNVANLTMLNNEYRTTGYGENAIVEKQETNGFGSQKEIETNEEVNQEEDSCSFVEAGDKSEEDLADLGMTNELVEIQEKDGIELLQLNSESDSSQSSEVVDAEGKSEAEMTEESCTLTTGVEERMEEVPEVEEKMEEVPEVEEKMEEVAGVEEKMEEVAELEPEMIEESVEFQEKNGIDSHADEVRSADSELTQHTSDSDSSHSSEIDEASPQDPSLGTLESVIHDLADKSLKQTVMQISIVLLPLISVAAFLYMRRKKASTIEPVQKLQPKEFVSGSTSTSIDSRRPPIERFCSQNWEIEEEMVAGNSGPSEMSSDFQNSSSFKDRLSERESEVQSSRSHQMGRNRNTESSSNYSAGSPSYASYGSFTTYEKLHNKHTYGEEVVTPVRRSSRIRKQVVSP